MSTTEHAEPSRAIGTLLSRMAALTSAQQQLLGRIAQHENLVTVTELADESGLHVSSVRETLDALYAHGLVVRRTLPAQGRGRPALGYTTYVPVDPDFSVRMLDQVTTSLFTWLRASRIDEVETARQIGAQWAHEALRMAHVPDHSTHSVNRPGFSLANHMGKIRLFLTAMGMAAEPCSDNETSFLVTACPFGDQTNPDPLALEMRRGLVERVLTLTSSGTADIEYLPDPHNPLRARINLTPRPQQGPDSATTTVHFYGGASEAAGVDSLDLPADTTPPTLGALIDHLSGHTPALAPILDVCSFLVAGHSADRDSIILPGSRIDVLPPFAGG